MDFGDFGLNLIASIMDDTSEDAKNKINEMKLPKYIVKINLKRKFFDCSSHKCADCMKCYRKNMKSITTILR